MRGSLSGTATAHALVQGELTPLRFQKAALFLKTQASIDEFFAQLASLDPNKRAQVENGMKVYLPHA